MRRSTKDWTTSVAEGLLIEASLFAICAATDDKKEGTSAFLAKRAPKFQGTTCAPLRSFK